jgi:hypothetical protein
LEKHQRHRFAAVPEAPSIKQIRIANLQCSKPVRQRPFRGNAQPVDDAAFWSFLTFENSNLFEIWCLELGASKKSGSYFAFDPYR